MYSVDLKNIVPKGVLTCLFAKATFDESKLWHRRLGHLNFKTINKMVKGNLVRGLPSKLFENVKTCVAYQKRKQHRASCKTKTENSISQPLYLLHRDLFGQTFVKRLMKKMYCLVVTNDYSRFTWVFFLATKDETTGILKSFITRIKNPVDHKVKMIRCDNGTEFKNREMNQFCEMKSILRQYSVARTPQQNGVAERRNKTLIEVARTMLADSKLLPTFWAEAVNTPCYVKRIVEENLHIKFSENTPNVKGSGPDWLFDIDVLTRTINYEPIVAGTQSNSFVGMFGTNGSALLIFSLTTLTSFVLAALTLKSFYDSSYKKFKLDRGYVGRASTIQGTRSLDFSGFTTWKKSYRIASETEARWIFISQDKYVAKILKKYRFTEVKNASTPMETQKPLLKDEDGEEVYVHMCTSMSGSLMYLTSLMPDIMFVVCACARYQVNLKFSHLHALKRIFRYLKGHIKLGLWYPKDSHFDLVAYTNSDYARASLDRKSTTGGCQYLGCRLISW
uniref:Putative ribonuclease H-like domain-containing protein n=1 Tax=Tanacetum cinerariifolium TaxID=118510 RepID=A0A699JE35_TANCI|nr:putative ribonuclease H-like domain-containing protein [Tanacetum cinerariifolium]